MNRRGQLVLVAAGVIAVALVPMLAAYLQLGYAADVRSAAAQDSPTADAVSELAGAASDVASDHQADHAWDERAETAEAVRSGMEPRIETVEEALVEHGIVRSVAYNASLATTVATEECPGGSGRAFGDCAADGGIVLQERAGDTHVVAVAVDVASTTERGQARVARVLSVP